MNECQAELLSLLEEFKAAGVRHCILWNNSDDIFEKTLRPDVYRHAHLIPGVTSAFFQSCPSTGGYPYGFKMVPIQKCPTGAQGLQGLIEVMTDNGYACRTHEAYYKYSWEQGTDPKPGSRPFISIKMQPPYPHCSLARFSQFID